MLTRQRLIQEIEQHLEGYLTIEDLASWAEEVFRTEEPDPAHADRIMTALSIIRDATDPHRFRWEEPDFDELVRSLSD